METEMAEVLFVGDFAGATIEARNLDMTGYVYSIGFADTGERRAEVPLGRWLFVAERDGCIPDTFQITLGAAYESPYVVPLMLVKDLNYIDGKFARAGWQEIGGEDLGGGCKVAKQYACACRNFTVAVDNSTRVSEILYHEADCEWHVGRSDRIAAAASLAANAYDRRTDRTYADVAKGEATRQGTSMDNEEIAVTLLNVEPRTSINVVNAYDIGVCVCQIVARETTLKFWAPPGVYEAHLRRPGYKATMTTFAVDADRRVHVTLPDLMADPIAAARPVPNDTRLADDVIDGAGAVGRQFFFDTSPMPIDSFVNITITQTGPCPTCAHTEWPGRYVGAGTRYEPCPECNGTARVSEGGSDDG